MTNRLRHLRRDERGMALVYVGLGFMGFLAATTLAIDVGMFMAARSQAQNAADAGALAGAVALAFNDYNDRTSSGPAVQGALSAARANRVVGGVPSITPPDVTFPLGPTGLNNRVQVTVYRTVARTNPIPTLFGVIFGVPTVDISATATAEASPANVERCILPFTVPDRWQENTTAPFDPTSSTFDTVDNAGRPLANPDVYIPVGQPGATGYDAERDKGIQLILKTNNLNKAAPSFYNPWAPPGGTGASYYRDNIGGCNTDRVKIGDSMTAEPGNMVGPTKQGTDDLVAEDPTAYWDPAPGGCNCVKGSVFGVSPRIRPLPLYDPQVYETGKENGRNADLTIGNYLGFFIEGTQGNQVVGRITPISGLVDGGSPVPTGAFPKAIRLVQ
jgi:Flp pilus assembly protein TadG